MHRVRDRWGNTIELTDERWRHIVTWHPDLADCVDEVLTTVKLGRRRQDAVEPTKYRFYRRTDRLVPDYSHIVVIVKLADRRFVLTAYPVLIHGKG